MNIAKKLIYECSYALDEIGQCVDVLYALREQCDVYTFTGSLGAGKTTLVQHILRRWGVQGALPSPTFTYVHTYVAPDGALLHHFDLYRLAHADDFYALGFDELLYQKGSWSFIEWPGIIETLLHVRVCDVVLEYATDMTRCMRVYQRSKACEYER